MQNPYAQNPYQQMQQQPQMQMQPQMQQMQMQPQMQQGMQQFMMNPQLQQKFMQIDSDHSGQITVDEIAKAYAHMKFTRQSAKLLLQGISDLPYIDMNAFPMFDGYVTSFWQAFATVCMGRPSIGFQQVQQAIAMLSFQCQPNTLAALVQKYDTDKRGVEFGEFMAICSYLLICAKLMNRFDPQKQGKLVLDQNGLQILGLWFM